MKTVALKKFLETQYRSYHRPEYLRLDPLICMGRFKDPRDIEIAGLVAAALAYGRAEIIIRNVQRIFEVTGPHPAVFAREVTLSRKTELLRDFRHRFNDGLDIALLLHSAGSLCKRHGSLESLFASGLAANADTIKDALDNFTTTIRLEALQLAPERKKSFNYLLPSPASGSACKRGNMFLRWMVRRPDGIDLGAWKRISPSRLVMPLDTHVARIARSLGLSRRRTADWRMAEEVTAKLRRLDPDDPAPLRFFAVQGRHGQFQEKPHVNNEIKKTLVFKGIPISSGKVAARVCLFSVRHQKRIPEYTLEGDVAVQKELDRLSQARIMCAEELSRITAGVEQSIGKAESEIFITQQHIMNDPKVVDAIALLITSKRRNAEWAINSVLSEFEELMALLTITIFANGRAT